MGLTNEHVGPRILAKIKIYVLTRAELLVTLCYEIPCIIAQMCLLCTALSSKQDFFEMTLVAAAKLVSFLES